MNSEEIKQAEKRLAEIKDKISVLNSESYAILQSLAEATCPFRVGQKITDGSGVEMIVSTVYSKYGRYRVKAKRIKKDGSLFKNEQEVWWLDRCKPCDE